MPNGLACVNGINARGLSPGRTPWAASTNVDVGLSSRRAPADTWAMSQQTLTAPTSAHFHVWRVALTGKAAFMSRPYRKRDAATQAARRWATDAGWRMVQECKLGEHCPRQPQPVNVC